MAHTYGTMSSQAASTIPSSASTTTVRAASPSGDKNRNEGAERHSTDASPLLSTGHAEPDLGHGSEVGPSAGFWSCTNHFVEVPRSPVSNQESTTYQHQGTRTRTRNRNFGKTDVSFVSTLMLLTINLANTILGTGMLAMPAALAAVGVVLGSFMIVFSACASSLGLYFLTRSASKTQGRAASFFACSKLTYPSAAVWFDLAIAIKCFGVGISYLIIIGDLMPGVVRSLSMVALAAAGGDGSGTVDPVWWFLEDRRFWITIFMGIIGPLAFLKRLDSLKATSALALSAVFYLVFIVVYYFSDPDLKIPSKKEIRYFHLTGDFFTTLPIFVFAFTCHQNIFSVYNELTDNGQSMLNRIISTSIGSAVVVYHVIGVLGYLTFGNAVGSNIIQMYDDGMLVTIGRIAIVVLVMFSFPLQCHPCRACLDKVLIAISNFWESTRFGKPSDPSQYSSLPGQNQDEDGTLASSEELDDHGNPIVVQSELKFVIMTLSILLGSYIIAITVSELEVVLSLVGSTGSTAISFILPGVFYWKLHAHHPWDVRKVLSVCLTVYGIMVMIICLSANIRRIVSS